MSETPAILDRYHRAVLSKSADDLAELYAPDGVHEYPFFFPGMPERFEGREAIREGCRAIWGPSPARPQRVEEVAVHVSADGEVITVEHIVHGTLAPTGQEFSFPGLLVLRVRDGLITHARDYMDGLRVAHTMGVLPALAAAVGTS
ncbi:nuclear transport factor 2 family protein [Streptomyces sp. AV19]|uniref:nuclear transport factor 2 family protein n=1 Tax=Streptomyces sp. AV19 TaxID=2793068 RepID=UPI001F26B0BB|nr:nuclear transport factor 2 family protein [Streptomyces sp. AV19]MDG4532132.1 nuclear transport factor 2 family protein [Streptomyces sp. AV19]